MSKPACPVCVAEVTEIHWEGGFQATDPYALGGLVAVGTWTQVRWAATGGGVKVAPEHDVITLAPCGHELRGEAMTKYREQMTEMQR